MKSTLIKDTTKEERIALIKEWLPEDDGMNNDGGMDLWDFYEYFDFECKSLYGMQCL